MGLIRKTLRAMIIATMLLACCIAFTAAASYTGISDDAASYAASSFSSKSPFTKTRYSHNGIFNNKATKITHGIDISQWQGKISLTQWKKMKAAGVDYVYVRVGYRGTQSGELFEDKYYKSNIVNANKAGIKVGVYIFSQAISTSESKAEANFLLDRVGNYNITMPLVFDYEYYSGGRLNKAKLSKSKMTSISKAYCKKIQDAGYTPMVYASLYFLRNSMDGNAVSKDYKIWCAQYYTKCGFGGEYDFWQYSSSGKISGVKLATSTVDCNFWYNDGETFNAVPRKVKGGKCIRSSSYANTIKWKKAKGTEGYADGYYIYRSNVYGKGYKKIATVSGSTTTYYDKYLAPGREYYYKVAGYKKAHGKVHTGAASKTIKGPVKQSYKMTAQTTKKAYIWNNAGPSKKKLIRLKKGIKPTVLGYTTSATGYTYYKVKYKSGKKSYTGYMAGNNLKISVSTNVNMVSNVKKVSAGSNSIKISWNGMKHIYAFQIYRSTSANSNYQKIATLDSITNSFTDKNLRKGTTYYYKVRAYAHYGSKNTYGKFNVPFAVATTGLSTAAEDAPTVEDAPVYSAPSQEQAIQPEENGEQEQNTSDPNEESTKPTDQKTGTDDSNKPSQESSNQMNQDNGEQAAQTPGPGQAENGAEQPDNSSSDAGASGDAENTNAAE